MKYKILMLLILSSSCLFAQNDGQIDTKLPDTYASVTSSNQVLSDWKPLMVKILYFVMLVNVIAVIRSLLNNESGKKAVINWFVSLFVLSVLLAILS